MKNKNMTILIYIFIVFQMIGILFSYGYHLSIINLGIILFITLIISYIINFISKYIRIPSISILQGKIVYSFDDYKTLIKNIIIVMLLWLPLYIIFYPGIFSYDVHRQIGYYTTWQPLFHSLIINFFYNLFQNRNIGIGIYTFFQMLVFAGSISYELLLLHRMKVKRIIIIMLLLFFSLLPAYSILSISTTKDILFSSFFILLVTSIVYKNLDELNFYKRKIYIIYMISLIMISLLRNNGLYIAILFIFISILIKSNKRIRKINFITLLIITISSLSLLFVLHPMIGHENEKYSAVYQQMGYIYNNSHINNIDKEKIKDYIPDVGGYNYYLADFIKDTGVGYKDRKGFLLLSIKLFTKYPVESIESFLRTNQGYWYLFDTSSTNIYNTGYFFIIFREGLGVSYNKTFKNIRDNILDIIINNRFKYFFPIVVLMNMALYTWIIIFLFGKSFVNNKNKTIEVFSLIILLYITLLLGPCVLNRYALPSISSIPALCILVYKSKNT